MLKRALTQAARSWRPAGERPNMAKIKKLQAQRTKVNAEIKRERSK